MKKRWKLWLLVLGLLAVAAVGLYAVHPLAPLVLLASLLIQAPLIVLAGKAAFGKSYAQRADLRRKEFEKTADGERWLAGEEAEAARPEFRYWSKKGRALSALNRAAAALAAGQRGKAAAFLAQCDAASLREEDAARYVQLVGQAARGGMSPADGAIAGTAVPPAGR